MQSWEYCVLVWEEASVGMPEIYSADALTTALNTLNTLSDDDLEAMAESGDVSSLNLPPPPRNKGWIEYFAEERQEGIASQAAAVTQLGRTGWELVSVVHQDGQESMYFKRQVEAN